MQNVGLFIGHKTGNVFLLKGERRRYVKVVQKTDDSHEVGYWVSNSRYYHDYSPYCGPVDSEMLKELLNYG